MTKTTKPDKATKLVVDVRTGEASSVPLTAEELADLDRRERDAAEQAKAAEAKTKQRDQALATARAEAAKNPAYAALARLAGVDL